MYLGIEGGATHTVAIYANGNGECCKRVEAGPGNILLLTDSQLVLLFRQLSFKEVSPQAVGIGMAGARTPRELDRIRSAAKKIWPQALCYATHDLETALAATGQQEKAQVLVLSGTGACCFGLYQGRQVRVGGWGHFLGDQGSGYDIGLQALRKCIAYYDQTAQWPELGARILSVLLLNEPDELILWVQNADKPSIAALAKTVFSLNDAGDKLARTVLKEAAQRLADNALCCAKRLGEEQIEFVLTGGVLHQKFYQNETTHILRRMFPKSKIALLEREGAWGAVALAQRMSGAKTSQGSSGSVGSDRSVRVELNLTQSPTEQRNPKSMNLDRLSVASAVDLMLEEESVVTQAILKEKKHIVQAVVWIARALKNEGRLFYAGAGTSGRLGVLDASECPPTFGSDPAQIQGIIAGGQRALWEAVEGAEDDREAGARSMEFRKVSPEDVVVGIAASGRTPFVWGALDKARERKAKTILLTFNPHVQIPAKTRPGIVIAPNVGPEILTGSTRLKAGTATKLILNIFTTLSMVQCGKVIENLMVDVKASNVKLRDRAVRIFQQLTGIDTDSAWKILEENQWNIKKAISKNKPTSGRNKRRDRVCA